MSFPEASFTIGFRLKGDPKATFIKCAEGLHDLNAVKNWLLSFALDGNEYALWLMQPVQQHGKIGNVVLSGSEGQFSNGPT